jgi:hypothetical protein
MQRRSVTVADFVGEAASFPTFHWRDVLRSPLRLFSVILNREDAKASLIRIRVTHQTQRQAGNPDSRAIPSLPISALNPRNPRLNPFSPFQFFSFSAFH